MTPLLTLGYWFSPTPPPFIPFVDASLLVIFAACIVVGIVAHVIRMKSGMDKLSRRAIGRAGTRLISMGFVGLVLYAFSYERVPFLMMRIFFLVWTVVFVVLAYRVYRYAFVEIPKIKESHEERDRLARWLPRKKV